MESRGAADGGGAADSPSPSGGKTPAAARAGEKMAKAGRLIMLIIIILKEKGVVFVAVFLPSFGFFLRSELFSVGNNFNSADNKKNVFPICENIGQNEQIRQPRRV